MNHLVSIAVVIIIITIAGNTYSTFKYHHDKDHDVKTDILLCDIILRLVHLLISHISDIHLGYSQFNLQEREEDMYEVFEEAIDKSISEHAHLIILAGDIFHTPRPNGSSIIKLANQLKKLKEKSIPVYFILGEHDINRMQDIPIPYVFHNLGLATRLKENEPRLHDNVAIFGFNKERKSNIESMLQQFKITEKKAKQSKESSNGGRSMKNILVLHQGLTDFNSFAGELNSTDLPRGIDYYAMGHYHDHIEKRFDYLDGLISYPGSIDLTPSEGIKQVEKGFFLTDISSQEVETNWVKLDKRRSQLVFKVSYKSITEELNDIIKETRNYDKKPVVMLKVLGKQIDSKVVASQLLKLNDTCLHYMWKPIEEQGSSPLVYDERPIDIDNELERLIKEVLKSDYLASLVLNEILPMAGRGDASATLDFLWKAYNNTKHQDHDG
ncbi:MAG: DNA repair exonuclease [Thermoproteota archaeon]|nr:DNA repair exonuclease [Thermoproteota archaeon]